MTNVQTFSTSLSCTLSDLTIQSQDGILTHLQSGKGMQISALMTFNDEVNNQLVKLLMTTDLHIRVSFYAKPDQPGRDVELGSVLLNTSPDTLTYKLNLDVADSVISNLSNHRCYQVSAIARVGTTPLCIPSLMRVYVEGPKLPDNSSEIGIEPSPEELEPEVAVSKTTRRRPTAAEKSPKK